MRGHLLVREMGFSVVVKQNVQMKRNGKNRDFVAQLVQFLMAKETLQIESKFLKQKKLFDWKKQQHKLKLI